MFRLNWKVLLPTIIVFGFLSFLIGNYFFTKKTTTYKLSQGEVKTIQNQLRDVEKIDTFIELGSFRLFCVIGEVKEEKNLYLPNGDQVISSAPCSYKKQEGNLETINLILSLNFSGENKGIILGMPSVSPALTIRSTRGIIINMNHYKAGSKILIHFGFINDENLGLQSSSYIQDAITSFHTEQQLLDFAKTGNPTTLPNGYLLPINVSYNLN